VQVDLVGIVGRQAVVDRIAAHTAAAGTHHAVEIDNIDSPT